MEICVPISTVSAGAQTSAGASFDGNVMISMTALPRQVVPARSPVIVSVAFCSTVMTGSRQSVHETEPPCISRETFESPRNARFRVSGIFEHTCTGFVGISWILSTDTMKDPLALQKPALSLSAVNEIVVAALPPVITGFGQSVQLSWASPSCVVQEKLDRAGSPISINDVSPGQREKSPISTVSTAPC